MRISVQLQDYSDQLRPPITVGNRPLNDVFAKPVLFGNTLADRVSPLTLKTVAYTVQLSGINKPFRLVQISDTHFNQSNYRQYWQDFAKRVIEAKPDVIAFTGDGINTWSDDAKFQAEMELQRATWQKITQGRPNALKLAILGNHDRMAMVSKNPSQKECDELIANYHTMVQQQLIPDNAKIQEFPQALPTELVERLKGLKKLAIRQEIHQMWEALGFIVLDKKVIDEKAEANPTWENTFYDDSTATGVRFIGLDDAAGQDPVLGTPARRRLETALNTNQPVIFLVHNPRHIRSVMGRWRKPVNAPCLILAGDTHKGHTHPLQYYLKLFRHSASLKQKLVFFYDLVRGNLPVYGVHSLAKFPNGKLYINAGAGISSWVGENYLARSKAASPEIAIFDIQPTPPGKPARVSFQRQKAI